MSPFSKPNLFAKYQQSFALQNGDGAIFSEDRRYRYALWRMWDVQKPYINFIMLNPSTADENANDATIRGLITRVRNWEMKGDDTSTWKAGGIVVTNLYGFRATNPDDLRLLVREDADPVGIVKNDHAIVVFAGNAKIIVAAWGAESSTIIPGRAANVLTMLRAIEIKPWALGVNKDGSPKHPLYIAHGFKPVAYFGVN